MRMSFFCTQAYSLDQRGALLKPADLIKILEQLPADKEICCQVVDKKGNAFNCHYEFQDIPKASLIALTVSHPQLEDLYDLKKP
jgi:hypothetical protein